MTQRSIFGVTEVSKKTRESTLVTFPDLESALAYLEEQGYEMIDDLKGRKYNHHFGPIVATITQVLVDE